MYVVFYIHILFCAVSTIETAFHSLNFELRKLFDKIEWNSTRILNMIFYQFNRIGCCFCCYIKTYSRFKTWIYAMKNFIKIVIIWFQHRWNSNKLWILLHSYMHKDVPVITFINRIYNGIFNLIIAEYQFFIGFNAIFLPWISPSFPMKYHFNLSNLLYSLPMQFQNTRTALGKCSQAIQEMWKRIYLTSTWKEISFIDKQTNENNDTNTFTMKLFSVLRIQKMKPFSIYSRNAGKTAER